MPDRDPLLSLASDVRHRASTSAAVCGFDNCHEIPPHHFSALAKPSMGLVSTAGELARIEGGERPEHDPHGEQPRRGGVRRAHPRPRRRPSPPALLTEAAEMVQRTRASRDDWMVRRLQGLSPDELKVLREATDILQKVIHA